MQDVDTFEQIKLKKMAGQFIEDIFTPLVECQQCFRIIQVYKPDLTPMPSRNHAPCNKILCGIMNSSIHTCHAGGLRSVQARLDSNPITEPGTMQQDSMSRNSFQTCHASGLRRDVDTFEQINLKKMAGQFIEDIFPPSVECKQCFRRIIQVYKPDLTPMPLQNLSPLTSLFVTSLVTVEVVTPLIRFGQEYGQDPPERHTIAKWHNQLQETGSVLRKKGSGKKPVTAARIETVREAFQRKEMERLIIINPGLDSSEELGEETTTGSETDTASEGDFAE
ncbi:hypothetical protein C0J52_19334 [Blattella germanica]|nr:hypothetical protein C0J52_19334 [Blattella germanica]